jgi:hypothetical protein
MSPLEQFWVAMSLIAAAVGSVIAIGANFDRVAVFLLRRLNLPLFPTAISMAMLIIQRPEQWSFDHYRMSHPDIGSIWIANGAYGLHVETAIGDWKPNFIERRIIREAVDWRIEQYLRERLQVAAERNMLR